VKEPSTTQAEEETKVEMKGQGTFACTNSEEDDGGTRPVHTLSGFKILVAGAVGEQSEQDPSHGKEGEANHRLQKHSTQKSNGNMPLAICDQQPEGGRPLLGTRGNVLLQFCMLQQ
jgi:hypothetical protein